MFPAGPRCSAHDCIRLVVALAMSLQIAACSEDVRTAPTAPTGLAQAAVPAGLYPGPNILHVSRYDAISPPTPSRYVCSHPTGQVFSALHHTNGELQRDGDAWMFTGGESGGTLSLRFRVIAGAKVTVEGALQGSALDAGWAPLFSPSGQRLTTDSATLTGEISPALGLVGTVTGALGFTEADGRTTTCSEARIQFTPRPPAGP